jgi:PAS domain S-box-containing protein
MTGSLPDTRIARWAVPAVLALGLALSVGGGVLADRHVQEKADDRLNALADLAAGRVAEQVAHFAGLTRALQASFLDLSVMPAVKFREFVGILRLHAGTQPVQSYVFAEQRDGDLHIRHAEPAAGNEGLPGLRVSANPAAAVALDRLRAEGALSATPPFALAHSSSGAPGMAFLAPVYLTETQPPRFAVKGRRLAGIVAITVNLDRLLAPLTAQLREQQVRLRVSAVPSAEAGASAVPFHSGNDAALQGGARYAAQRDVEVQGTQWRLTLDAGPDLIPFPLRDLALIVPAVLLTLTLLLAALVHTLVRSRRLAERHAEEVTRDLRQSEARFRDLAELSSDWYWEQDAQFRFTQISGGVYSKSGVDPSSTIGRLRWEMPAGEDSGAEWAEHRAQLQRHEPFRDFTYRMQVSDGDLRWFTISGRPVFAPDGRFAGYRGTGSDITDRKQSESALRRERDFAASLVNTAPVIILLLDPRGVIQHVNPYFEQLTGYRLDEVKGREWFAAFIPERDRERIRRLFQDALHDDPTRGNINPIVIRSGEEREIEWNAQAMRDDQGLIASVLAIGLDVTERQQAGIQLRLAATVFENSREGVTMTDARQNIISVNRAFTEITGYEMDEVIGKNPRILQSGRQDTAFYKAMWTSIREKGYWSGEIWNRRKTGEIYPELLSITEVRDAQGDPIHYIGVFTDITELKQAEQALRESEALLNKAQEVAQTGSWTLDASTNRLDWSRETYRIFGIAPGIPLSYALFLECLHPDDHKAVEDAWNNALQGAPYDIEHRIVVAGTEKWVRERAELIFDGEGRLLRGIGTVQDITKLKRAQQEIRQLNESLEQRVRERTAALEASNRELEAFSYSVSHDLRAPLRGIDGFAHILAEDYGGRLDEAGRGYLQRIRQASQRLSQTIDDMIELARITRAPLHRRVVDLSTLARAILLELAQASRHRPEIAIAESVTAQADPTLLRVALENLLDNAWKFTSRTEPARIEFGTQDIDGERNFFVRDNGAGFDPAYADKLFLPFQRLHRPDEFAGTGIGLATVQRIIQRHGGRIRAEGSPGSGAVIYFTLP